MWNFLSRDPVLTTFTNPQQTVPCQPVSPSSLLYLVPVSIQCALLYPHLEKYRLLRWLRLILLPIGVYYSLRLPIAYCWQPLSRRGYLNLTLSCAGFHLAMKAIEWGLISGYENGRLWKRPEFAPNGPTTVSLKKSDEPPQKQQKPMTLRDWHVWTMELLSSPRGVQYGWGVRANPNAMSALSVVWRMYRVNVVHVFATAFAILCRDHESPANALRVLGVPQVPGLTIVAEALSTLAFGFYLVSTTDVSYGYYTLLAHLINAVHSYVHFPSWFIEFFNMKLYVPWYDAPHRVTSLAHLWGKAWHQNFRRIFLFCGGIPATKLARSLRLGSHLQRVAGLWGSFIVSGILHEFAIHCIARKPHPHPHVFFHEFPGSFTYFFLQPLGILVEPYVIPLIPGGGIVWCYAFTLLTATPFRIQYFHGRRLLDDNYPSLTMSWFIAALIVPGFTFRGRKV